MPENLDALYAPPEKVEREILGVKVVLKPITGEEYMDVAQEALDQTGLKLNRRLYMRKLIERCVEEPANLDVGRLNPAAIALLVSEIEDFLGVSEVARKKFELR